MFKNKMFKNTVMGVEKIKGSHDRGFFENLGTSIAPPVKTDYSILECPFLTTAYGQFHSLSGIFLPVLNSIL
jgi:hypothetical protein